MDVLVLPVAGASVTVALTAIRETLPLGAVAPLPGAPPAVLGAINVHGEVLVLLDTALLLGREPLEDVSHAVVASVARGTAALAATGRPATAVIDAAGDVLELDAVLDPARIAAAGC